jgi:hypothetical protein
MYNQCLPLDGVCIDMSLSLAKVSISHQSWEKYSVVLKFLKVIITPWIIFLDCPKVAVFSWNLMATILILINTLCKINK